MLRTSFDAIFNVLQFPLRLKMYRYANLSGLELLDRAQRHSEDRRICRLREPPSRPSQPIALGFLVPWSLRLSLSLGPIGHRTTIGMAMNCQYNRPNRKCARLSPLRPIDLALTLHGGRVRVLDLDPSISATHAVRGPKALGYDALAAERTSILVDQSAVAAVGLVERNAWMELS
jgi:hypothetical protein